MSERHTQYDEVTFALYYDHELDAKEAKLFELSLERDEQLMEAYNQWVDVQEAVHHYFEDKESSYKLDHFSDRVMKALPADPNWRTSKPPNSEPVAVQLNTDSPWWQTWLTPMLIGGLVTAALMLIVQGFQGNSVQQQRSTVLINYPDQEEQGDKAPVIWLLDEDEENDQEQDEENDQDQDAEDI